MSLKKCPECNKDISDLASSCPHCGYPISKSDTIEIVTKGKKRFSKKILIILIISISIIILGLILLIININNAKKEEEKEKANRVVQIINGLEYTDLEKNSTLLNNIDTIKNAKKEYDKLSDSEKTLVDNYDSLEDCLSKLESLSIKITKKNINKYFDIKFSTSNFDYDSDLTITGLSEYKATADLSINVEPKLAYKDYNLDYNNISFTLEFDNVYRGDFESCSWQNRFEISLDENGKYTTNKTISYNSLTEPSPPDYDSYDMLFSNVTGKILYNG